jgi:hypothetical protein
MYNTIPVEPKVRNVRNVVMLLQDRKFHNIMDMELRGLLTDSMEHGPSFGSNHFSASQRMPHILWNIRFITAFISAHSEVYMCRH